MNQHFLAFRQYCSDFQTLTLLEWEDRILANATGFYLEDRSEKLWKEKHFKDLFVFAGTVQSPLNQAAMTSSPPVSRSPPCHSFIASSAQKVVHLVSLWVQATAFPPSVASWCFDQWWYYHAGSVAPWLSDRRPILWQGCLKTTFFSGAIQICSTNLPS